MRVNDIQGVIESFAYDVEDMHRASVQNVDFSVVPVVVENGAFPEIHSERIDAVEYGAQAKLKDVSVHELCVACVRQVIADMPAFNCKLYWRTYPEYDKQEDFATGELYHKVYFRVGWGKVWE